jgi:hypothetical protein
MPANPSDRIVLPKMEPGSEPYKLMLHEILPRMAQLAAKYCRHHEVSFTSTHIHIKTVSHHSYERAMSLGIDEDGHIIIATTEKNDRFSKDDRPVVVTKIDLTDPKSLKNNTLELWVLAALI